MTGSKQKTYFTNQFVDLLAQSSNAISQRGGEVRDRGEDGWCLQFRRLGAHAHPPLQPSAASPGLQVYHVEQAAPSSNRRSSVTPSSRSICVPTVQLSSLLYPA